MAVEVNPLALLVSFAGALLAPTLTVYLLLAYRMERGFEEVHEELRKHAEGERDRIAAVVSDALGRDGGVEEHEPRKAAPVAEPDPPSPDPGPRYLVVDDSRPVVRTVEAYLEQEGTDPDEVLTAGDAAEALELFRQHRPEVVVLDIELPDLDGHDIARQIRALEPETRIVVISSLGDDDPRIQTVAEIASRRVEKPVERRDVADLDRLVATPGPADPDPSPPTDD